MLEGIDVEYMFTEKQSIRNSVRGGPVGHTGYKRPVERWARGDQDAPIQKKKKKKRK